MHDEPYPEYMFYSPRFGIDPGEVEETNPYMFGKELATWLGGQLRQRGYETNVVPEDWGWCVICQRKPFTLFVGCLSALDKNLVERCDDPRSDADILWRAIPVAEKSIFQRSATELDVESGLTRLRNDVKAILESDPTVRFATEQEIAAWESAVVDLVDEKINDVYEPKPVSRWISVPVSLIMLPVLFLSAAGAVSLLYDNPEEYDVIRPVIGIVLLILIILLGSVAVRMLFGRPAPHGGLFPPSVLRIFAVVFFMLPIGGLFTGWYAEHPVTGTVQAVTYFLVSLGLWRLARYRKDRLERSQENAD